MSPVGLDAVANAFTQLFLDRIHTEGLDANVSLKLTAMGLDISEAMLARLRAKPGLRCTPRVCPHGITAFV